MPLASTMPHFLTNSKRRSAIAAEKSLARGSRESLLPISPPLALLGFVFCFERDACSGRPYFLEFRTPHRGYPATQGSGPFSPRPAVAAFRARRSFRHKLVCPQLSLARTFRLERTRRCTLRCLGADRCRDMVRHPGQKRPGSGLLAALPLFRGRGSSGNFYLRKDFPCRNRRRRCPSS